MLLHALKFYTHIEYAIVVEHDLDWATIVETPIFAPVLKQLSLMVVKDVWKVLLEVYPDIDLSYLDKVAPCHLDKEDQPASE